MAVIALLLDTHFAWELKLLGVPFFYGQPHQGVKNAAKYLRDHGLLERISKNLHMIDLGDIAMPDTYQADGNSKIKNLKAVSQANFNISQTIENLDLTKHFLLNIGGDHGMGLGTVHGILSHHPETVVIWADAHCNINKPETST